MSDWAQEQFIHTIMVSGDAWDWYANMLEIAVDAGLYVTINGVKATLVSFDPWETGTLTAQPVDKNNDAVGPLVKYKPEELKVIRIL